VGAACCAGETSAAAMLALVREYSRTRHARRRLLNC
jgi:hypothetical protein